MSCAAVGPRESDRARLLPFSASGAGIEARRPGLLGGLLGRERKVDAKFLDVSSVGLRFLSNRRLPLETPLRLTVTFSSGLVEFQGRVRWVHPEGRTERFIVGVAFGRLTEVQLQRLEQARAAALRTA